MTHQPNQSKPQVHKGYIIDPASLKLWLEQQAAGVKVQSGRQQGRSKQSMQRRKNITDLILAT